MSDNEIRKALECCTDCNCKECPCCRIIDGGIHCTEIDEKEILDLINRQKAENESLKIDLAKCSIRLDNLYETAERIKSEAIKEFAERLRNCFCVSKEYLDIVNIIDNLVKEMTE